MFYTFDNIANFRELGGIPTVDGHRVRSGLLFRCGELHKASDADIARLSEGFHVSKIIDFRDTKETEIRTDREVPGAEYISIPALPPMPAEPMSMMKDEHPLIPPQEMFPYVYRQLASSLESEVAYRAFFDQLLHNDGKPVLWHCKQGKDRTGVAAILLLTALGVRREEWMRDYMLTNEYMTRRYEEKYASLSDEQEKEFRKIIMFVREDWLGQYLDIVEEKGGLLAFLHNQIGVTDAEIEQLKAMYLA